MKALYLEPDAGISAGYKHHLSLFLAAAGLNAKDVWWANIHNKVKGAIKKKGNGQKYLARAKEVQAEVDGYINTIRPDILIVNDEAVVGILSAGAVSLEQTRGSVYVYKGLPCMVLGDVAMINRRAHGKWLFSQDIGKLKRWLDGTRRCEPKFEYTVIHSAADAYTAYEYLKDCIIIGSDLETRDDWIDCISYCGVKGTEVRNYLFPFFNPLKPGGCHWQDDEEHAYVWSIVAAINACEVPKAYHNGVYDSAYLIRHNVPPTNFFFDTQVILHSLFCELPKSLNFVASICVDTVQYWKEDLKGSKEEGMPKTQAALDRFWRYCCQDSYYTIMSLQTILHLLINTDWAMHNYIERMMLNLGPGLNMSMRGIWRNPVEFKRLRDEWSAKATAADEKLAIMMDDPDFNPGSPPQCKELFYTVLGATKRRVRGKTGATDEPTLKFISLDHPFVEAFARAILDCREPRKLISTYFNYKQRRTRFHYAMRADGTNTSRFASGKFMWEGTNVQNIPDKLRTYLAADPGYTMFNVDYSQSDARFVAYESGDAAYIRNVESDRDTHCVHGAHFFGETYDHFNGQYAAKDPKYADPRRGLRQCTKKVVHGSNYLMGAGTLLETIIVELDKDAVITAATAIGYVDAHLLNDKQLIQVCGKLLNSYHTLYPELKPWYERVIAIVEEHRTLTTALGFTRLFFGDPTSHTVKREAVAFLGQGGTGGNINRTLLYLWYGCTELGIEPLDGKDLFLLMQGHDSILGQVKTEKLHILKKVVDIMELPVIINGVERVIPTDTKIGPSWGDTMKEMKWNT